MRLTDQTQFLPLKWPALRTSVLFGLLQFSVVYVLGLLLAPPAYAEFDPLSAYGSEIRFDVIRNNRVIGEHVTRFEHENDKLKVLSTMRLEIEVFFIPVYDFSYTAQEIWGGGDLQNVSVQVADGGDDFAINLAFDDGLISPLPSSGYATEGARVFYSTNHWHPNVVHENYILNTLTGKINQVSIEQGPREQLTVSNGSVWATRYDYFGDLTDTSAWYDDQDRWVKLRFKARDGSLIEYFCQSCAVNE